MNLHFAGSDASEQFNVPLRECGAQYRLESYHTLKGKAPSEGFTLLLDSGGFVARTKGVEINVKDYANYINKHDIKLAFELDTNSVEVTTYNREYLCKETKAKIIPVYHFSDWKDNKKLLFEFMDNFDYISVGGVAGEHNDRTQERKFYDYVFYNTRDKVKVHGLGITAVPLLKRYPFFSVDSTSYLSFCRFGSSQVIEDELWAFYLLKSRHFSKNLKREIEYWLDVQETMTGIWNEKKVVWS